jgi:hypothetical protein
MIHPPLRPIKAQVRKTSSGIENKVHLPGFANDLIAKRLLPNTFLPMDSFVGTRTTEPDFGGVIAGSKRK